MNQRPDTPAVVGLIALAGLLVVGWVVLAALGKNVPPELWIALSTVVGVVGGWVGKTLTSEKPAGSVEGFDPPPVADVPLVEAGPVVNDRAEREHISTHLAEAGQ